MEIVKLIVVVVTIGVGIFLRFQPMPERVVGGGMIAIGVLLLAVWGRAAARGKRPSPKSPN